MAGVEQARLAFGVRLRELRRAARLSGAELAQRAGWAPSKVSKIEHGHQAPTEDDIAAWCEATDATLALPDLRASLTNLESMWAEWKRVTAGGHARRQRKSIELEAATASIRDWEPLIIPGLIQTEDYARAVLETCIGFVGGTDDIQDAVTARMQRQEALRTGRRRVSILLGEQALYTTVGDAGVMAGQLAHLLEVMTLPRLSLGVVPRTAEFIYTTTCFVLFDRRLAMVETISAELTITNGAELAYYEKTWARLHTQARYGASARELISAALEERRGSA